MSTDNRSNFYKVLIVEDSAEDRLVYKRYLNQDSDYTYEFEETDLGEVGLELCFSWQPDLILLDYRIPDINGLEFLEALSANGKELPCPIIILTGLGDETIATMCMKQGAYDYLVKSRITPENFRHSVQANLREYQRKLKERYLLQTTILESISDGFFALDADERIIYVNKSLEKQSNRSREAYLGKRIWDVLPHLKDQLIFPHIRKALTEQTSGQFENYYPLTQTWVKISVYPTGDGVSVYFQDITAQKQTEAQLVRWNEELAKQVEARTASLEAEIEERKQAEQALKENEQFLKAVINNANVLLFATDTAGKVTLAEGEAFRKIGLQPEQLVGKSCFEMSGIPPKIQADLKQVLEGKSISTVFENNEVTFENWYTPILGKDNRVTGITGLSIDISERVRSQNALVESENKYRSVISNIKEVIFQTDAQGLWTFLNRAWTEITGFSLEESIGQNFLDYVHPEDREKNLALFKPLIERQKEYCRHKVRYLTSVGSSRWIEVYARLTLNENDEIIGTSGTLRDITEQYLAEEALRYRFEFEQIISSISSSFINLEASEIDNEISHALARVGEFSGADRSYIFLLSEDGQEMSNTHEWCAEGIEPQISLLQNMSVSSFTWVMSYINRLENLHIPDLALIPPEAGAELQVLEMQSIQSFLLVPMVYEKKPVGYLGFDAVKNHKVWSDNDINLLKITGEIFTNAIKRKITQQSLLKERDFAQLVMTTMGQGLTVSNQHRKFRFVNQAYADMVGYLPEELLGKRPADLTHPDDLAELEKAFQHRMAGVNSTYETRLLHRDGSVRYVTITGVPLWQEKQFVGNIAVVTDLTERRQAEEALRESEERYALAVRGAKDGLWDWNIKTNKLYLSPRWKEILGYADAKITEGTRETWITMTYPEDREGLITAVTAHLEGQTAHFEHEFRMLHQDNTYRWILSRGLAVRDAKGRPYRMAGSITDITERKLTETNLEKAALQDALTGLPNRTLFMRRLTNALEKSRQDPHFSYAVLFVDLDRFKLVNDSLGHTVGDQLLLAIARRLTACLRPSDTVARVGGDEFIILLEDIAELSEARNIADRIQNSLARPFNLNLQEVFASASIGIAFSSSEFVSPEDILRSADTAMYMAKTLGKARYEIYDSAMHDRASQMLQMETDLRRAVERNEFLVYYQPIIRLEEGDLSGFEALVRWQHPERGLVNPDDFLSVAEETGLIVSIERYVLLEACRQIKYWNEKFGLALSVSVNLSSRLLAQKDLVDEVSGILAETGLAAEFLRVEITENIIMERAEPAIEVLEQLKKLGLQLYLDDFGTGYSSLSWLHRIPLNSIKVDRSFVNRLDFNNDKRVLVETIITMAHKLGLEVVAEGIETAEQLAQLKVWGCEFGQGYYFSLPLPSADTENLLYEQENATRAFL